MRNSSLARLFVFILILNLVIPLFVIGNAYQSKLNNDGYNIDNTSLKTSSISKDDFSALIESRNDHDLGNITINNMDFSGYDELGFYLYHTKYPTLSNDFNDEALNMTFVNMEFIETIEPAIKDNVLPVIQYQPEITVKLNETIDVRYNTTKSSSDGFLIYCPRLYPCEFIELHVQEEGTADLKQVNPGNYSIDENDFLRFNYADFFTDDILNFTMCIIWTYTISIVDEELDPWNIIQDGSDWIYINEPNQDVELLFAYEFTIKGEKYQGQSYNPDNQIEVSGIVANFSIIIPDRNLLTYDSLIVNSTSQPKDDLINAVDNSISSGFMELNGSHFLLNFTAQFNIEFIDTVGKYWAIDRLVDDSSIREKIYLVNITSGPEYLSIAWLMIQESSINKDQVIASECLFENRDVYGFEYNRSRWESPDYISDNPRERFWLNISLPYFIKNEVCPFSIQYNATEDLVVRIYDNIGMPLVGLEVVVDYQDEPYGTFISNDQCQPLSSQTTDINSEIIVKNVPMGDYIIHIYQYGLYQGTFTVNSYVEINYITSGIVHFPAWLLIFGLINLSILAIGYNLYRKKKIRDQ